MIRHVYAVLGLLLVLAPRNPIAAAEMFAPPPNRITPVRSPDGVTFEAYEWGNPDGKSIVFIHGIYQSALSWAKQVGDPALAHKYRLVAIDLRGHGASEKPDGAEFYREGKRWADDITALMDTLHLNRPVMVPWSYGGRVLNDYLAVNGDERLGGIVYVAVRSTTNESPEAPNVRRTEASRDALSSDPTTFIKGTREFVELCFGKPAAPTEIEWLTAASMQTPLYVRKQLAGRPLAYAEVLKSIRVPTLIIQGDIDAVVSPQIAQITHQLIPHSSLSIYHGVGHSSFFEAPERFNAELDRFMEGVQTSAR
jgi:pimeloyl-ACP methyl ester carboxylesterase